MVDKGKDKLGRFLKGKYQGYGFKKGSIPTNYLGYTIHAGYKYIHNPAHPYATKKGYVMEHRLVVESILDRYLLPNEEVHHINHVKLDNRPENLIVFLNSGYHSMFHKWEYENSQFISFDGRKYGGEK